MRRGREIPRHQGCDRSQHLCVFDGAETGAMRLIVGDDEEKIFALVFLKKLESAIGDAMAVAEIGGPGGVKASGWFARADAVGWR